MGLPFEGFILGPFIFISLLQRKCQAPARRFPSYIYVRGRFIVVQEGERERPEGGTTLGRSEQRSGSGRSRRPRADLTDFDGFHNGPASDDMIFV